MRSQTSTSKNMGDGGCGMDETDETFGQRQRLANLPPPKSAALALPISAPAMTRPQAESFQAALAAQPATCNPQWHKPFVAAAERGSNMAVLEKVLRQQPTVQGEFRLNLTGIRRTAKGWQRAQTASNL